MWEPSWQVLRLTIFETLLLLLLLLLLGHVENHPKEMCQCAHGNHGDQNVFISFFFFSFFYHFCLVLLCIWGQLLSKYNLQGGLTFGGAISRKVYCITTLGSYAWRGLFPEFYGMFLHAKFGSVTKYSDNDEFSQKSSGKKGTWPSRFHIQFSIKHEGNHSEQT